MPDVSVVVPVYNRRALLREAVDSVLSGAAGVDLEVIIVDDASTDDTWAGAQSFPEPVKAYRMERNSGQSAARNYGLQQAAGEFVLFLDSDDLLVHGFLARALESARRTAADLVVAGWGARWPDGREQRWPAPQFEGRAIGDALLAGTAVPTSAALHRRRPQLGWDPALRKLDDWDFFITAALSARTIATLDETAYWMREHESSRVTQQASMLANAVELYTILGKLEARLEASGALTGARRKRLAQYLYKELRVLCLHDRERFESVVTHIHELDPGFAPRDEEGQWWMRLAARILGTRRAVLAHTYVKRLARGDGAPS